METNAAETWLYGRLTADAALGAVVSTRIYNTRRPADSAFPLVVYQLQTARDVTFLGAVRVWANLTYLVRGIVAVFDANEQGSFEGAGKTIADRIDVALHAASGTNGSGTVYTCVRLSAFQQIETVNGQQFRHLGGIYQIQVR